MRSLVGDGHVQTPGLLQIRSMSPSQLRTRVTPGVSASTRHQVDVAATRPEAQALLPYWAEQLRLLGRASTHGVSVRRVVVDGAVWFAVVVKPHRDG